MIIDQFLASKRTVLLDSIRVVDIRIELTGYFFYNLL